MLKLFEFGKNSLFLFLYILNDFKLYVLLT